MYKYIFFQITVISFDKLIMSISFIDYQLLKLLPEFLVTCSIFCYIWNWFSVYCVLRSKFEFGISQCLMMKSKKSISLWKRLWSFTKYSRNPPRFLGGFVAFTQLSFSVLFYFYYYESNFDLLKLTILAIVSRSSNLIWTKIFEHY